MLLQYPTHPNIMPGEKSVFQSVVWWKTLTMNIHLKKSLSRNQKIFTLVSWKQRFWKCLGSYRNCCECWQLSYKISFSVRILVTILGGTNLIFMSCAFMFKKRLSADTIIQYNVCISQLNLWRAMSIIYMKEHRSKNTYLLLKNSDLFPCQSFLLIVVFISTSSLFPAAENGNPWIAAVH